MVAGKGFRLCGIVSESNECRREVSPRENNDIMTMQIWCCQSAKLSASNAGRQADRQAALATDCGGAAPPPPSGWE